MHELVGSSQTSSGHSQAKLKAGLESKKGPVSSAGLRKSHGSAMRKTLNVPELSHPQSQRHNVAKW